MLPTLLTDSQTVCHWEFYRTIQDIPGAIVECGVFRGRTLLRFAHFRHICRQPRQLIGFDTFTSFPEATGGDIAARQRFVERFGDKCLTALKIKQMLALESCDDSLTLVQGDICETVPEFTKRHPDTQIALLNMDVDLYEPTKIVLEYLYPTMAKGGLLLCDDYGIFLGATQATDEYCRKNNLALKTMPLFTGYYLEKDGV